MLRAVSPLLIWFWSAFPWLFCNFVFKSSVAASLMCDTMHDEWSQCQSAWECVDACMIVAMCATCVESWCVCVRIVMHANAWMICLCLICFTCHCIWTFACFALHCSWNAARDCEHMATMAAVCENFLKFYSNSISVHILQHLNTPPLFFAKSYFLLLSWTLGACLHLLCVWTTFLSLPAMIVTKIMKSCLSQ